MAPKHLNLVVLLTLICGGLDATNTTLKCTDGSSIDCPTKYNSCCELTGNFEAVCFFQNNTVDIIHEGEHYLAVGSVEFVMTLIGCIFTVLGAGIFSGLTLGLLTLDKNAMAVLMRAGQEKEKRYAQRLLPIVSQHHRLLVTLLLSNAIAMEALPVFLGRLVPEIAAIAISVTAVLFFGEVFPQALCSRYGLAIGYYLAWFVWFLMIVMYPVAYPVGKLLDAMLGKEHATFFRRNELSAFVELHQDVSIENPDPLQADEIRIIQGVLKLRLKTVKSIMTSLENVFMEPLHGVCDDFAIAEIVAKGHSRILLYDQEKTDAGSYFLAKAMIMFKQTEVRFEELPSRPLRMVKGSEPLFEILRYFQTGKSHIVGVKDDETDVLIGIITLEDVIEELLQQEIIDETDVFVDIQNKLRREKNH